MMESKPPPTRDFADSPETSVGAPSLRSQQHHQPQRGGNGNQRTDGYDMIASRIGFVPNLRAGDNMLQASATLVGFVIGAMVGFIFWGGLVATAIGAVIGLVSGAFLSGLALMVLGWLR